MSAKSRSSNGFWLSAVNLFRRLKPRQRGSFFGVASGNGVASLSARVRAGALMPKLAAAIPIRRKSRRVEGIKNLCGWHSRRWCRWLVAGPSPGATLPRIAGSPRSMELALQPRRGFDAEEARLTSGARADLERQVGTIQLVANRPSLGPLSVCRQVISAPEQAFRE